METSTFFKKGDETHSYILQLQIKTQTDEARSHLSSYFL